MDTRKALKHFKEEFESRIKFEYPHKLSFVHKLLWSMIYQAMKLSEMIYMFSVSEMLFRAYVEMYKEIKIRDNTKKGY